MVLICYDGSPDAKAAIDHGASLLKGEQATVLTIWQPFVNIVAHTPTFGLGAAAVDSKKIDEESLKAAEERAEGGHSLRRKPACERWCASYLRPLRPRTRSWPKPKRSTRVRS